MSSKEGQGKRKLREAAFGIFCFVLGFLGASFFLPSISLSLAFGTDDIYPFPAVAVKNDSIFLPITDVRTALYIKKCQVGNKGEGAFELVDAFVVMGNKDVPRLDSIAPRLRAGDTHTVDFANFMGLDIPADGPKLAYVDLTVVTDYVVYGFKHVHHEERFIGDRNIRGSFTYTAQPSDPERHYVEEKH